MAVGKTSTVESLLGVLSLGPKSGYEMRQFMEKSTANFWGESFGQIYPALKRMAAEGLVEVVEASGEGRPERKVYGMTAKGAQHLREWLSVPAERRPNRNELLLKVFYGDKTERAVVSGQVEAWRSLYAGDLERYAAAVEWMERECAGHPGMPYWRMTARYGMAEARAMLAWCDETLGELKRMEEFEKDAVTI